MSSRAIQNLFACLSDQLKNLKAIGALIHLPRASSVDRLSVVVYCKTCGEPAQLSRRWWSRRPKGISINKEALNMCVSGSVQQVDEPFLAGGFYNTS